MSRARYVREARYQGGGADRVLLERSDVNGDRASLVLRVEYRGGGGPFGGGVYSDEYNVSLVREQGEWRLARPMMGLWEAHYEGRFGEPCDPDYDECWEEELP